jgi:hypothetical protein
MCIFLVREKPCESIGLCWDRQGDVLEELLCHCSVESMLFLSSRPGLERHETDTAMAQHLYMLWIWTLNGILLSSSRHLLLSCTGGDD